MGPEGKRITRAAARELATQARHTMLAAERMLAAAGEEEAVQLAANTSNPITAVIKELYDGPPDQTFACQR